MATLSANRPEAFLVTAAAYLMGLRVTWLNPNSSEDDHVYMLRDLPLRRQHDLSGLAMVIYGQSEAPMALTVLHAREHEPERRLQRLVSCGTPMAGIQLRLLDEHGVEVAEGEVGEICARGPLVMAGYWNKPRETAAERITPQARRIDESHEFPRALSDELAARGWLGARVAPEFGGAGCDAVTACLILDEVSSAPGSVGNSLNAHLCLVSTLIAGHGSEAQKVHLALRRTRCRSSAAADQGGPEPRPGRGQPGSGPRP